MDIKTILTKLLRIGIIIYSILVLIYGIVFISVDLTQSIPYETLADLQNGKIVQIMICLPCIVIGMALLLTIIFYYALKIKKVNVFKYTAFAYFLLVFSILMLIAFTVIVILTKQLFLILVAIIPALGILSYSIYLINENKKYINTYNKDKTEIVENELL